MKEYRKGDKYQQDADYIHHDKRFRCDGIFVCHLFHSPFEDVFLSYIIIYHTDFLNTQIVHNHYTAKPTVVKCITVSFDDFMIRVREDFTKSRRKFARQNHGLDYSCHPKHRSHKSNGRIGICEK